MSDWSSDVCSSDLQLIDPFDGARDIERRVLRHVSDAFAEDPVRILRAARFMARFAALGFTIAPETLALMQAMVAAGEVAHLVRSEERRVGKEGVSTCRSRGSRYH